MISRGLTALHSGGLIAWFLILVSATPQCASADVLFDNGIRMGIGGLCDQGPTGCGGSGTWTHFDNFSLGTSSTITKFDYRDMFTVGTGTNYLYTNWSIWDADPFVAAAPIASGSESAQLTPTLYDGEFVFTIHGVGLTVPAGVYWLGINNWVANGAITSTIAAFGALPDNRQSDTSTNRFYDRGERVFTIYDVVPEPTTGALAASVVGMTLARRARRNWA